ncbi:hypothetical protein ACS0TY_015949 [Phlomoides rotata]
MEGEDSVRTVDCLRGRLLAERAASRNAKQDADQLGNKLMEIETLLKQEAKSRNRAEKKLKSLMKKLESFNIPYVSYESALIDKNDISSVSSTSSSTPNSQQQYQESEKNVISQKESKNSDSLTCLSSLSDDSFIAEDISISAFEIELKRQQYEMGRSEDASSPPLSQIFGRKTAQNVTSEDSLSSKMDQQSDIWYDGSITRSSGEEDDQDLDNQTDDSMALVLVETTQKNHTIDPEVLDDTVKEVLGALRYAKEQLQSSMERRRTNMISVG